MREAPTLQAPAWGATSTPGWMPSGERSLFFLLPRKRPIRGAGGSSPAAIVSARREKRVIAHTVKTVWGLVRTARLVCCSSVHTSTRRQAVYARVASLSFLFSALDHIRNPGFFHALFERFFVVFRGSFPTEIRV